MLLLLLVLLTGMALVVNWLLGDALRSDLRQRLEDKAGYAAVLQEQGVTGQTLADRLAGNGVLRSFTVRRPAATSAGTRSGHAAGPVRRRGPRPPSRRRPSRRR